MKIEDRVELYKKLFPKCKAIAIVKAVLEAGVCGDRLDALEQIRELNTELADAYMVSIPVITVWVRDNSYVPETGEIYLTEPELAGFLHQFRHHLQNVERKYERRGLTTEGDKSLAKIPYENCQYLLKGEDDARAWSRFLLEEARSKD